MKYIVTAIVAGKETTREIEIAECKNAAGELVVSVTKSLLKNDESVSYNVSVHITNLPADAQAKIAEKDLWLNTRSDKPGALVGEMTAKGKRTKQPGGLSVAGRPELQELYDALTAAKNLINDTRNQMFADARPAPVVIPAGMVKVVFVTSKLDGWVSVYSDDQGNEFDSPKLAGKDRDVAWMTQADYDAALQHVHAAAQAAADKEIRRLENIVATGEKLQAEGRLLTYAEQARRAREYDRAYNEGGDGYNPYRGIVSVEEYNAARIALAAK